MPPSILRPSICPRPQLALQCQAGTLVSRLACISLPDLSSCQTSHPSDSSDGIPATLPEVRSREFLVRFPTSGKDHQSHILFCVVFGLSVLSFRHFHQKNLVELTGIEPVTSCLQSRRSPN